MSDKVNKNMVLPEELKNKILNDNDFSLRLCLLTEQSQEALKKKVKRNSVQLFLPTYLNFYKENGFEELHNLCKNEIKK